MGVRGRGSIVGCVLCALLAVPAAASADIAVPLPEGPPPQLLPSVTSTLVAPVAKRADCLARPREWSPTRASPLPPTAP
jgi:hypothetical protein